MPSGAGMRFLWAIIDNSGMLKDSPKGDGETLNFDNGRKSVGFWLLRNLKMIDKRIVEKILLKAIEDMEDMEDDA